MMEACQDKYSTKIEITENGMFKVTEPDKTTTWQYLVNEKGELLVSPLETNVQNSAIKDVYYNIDAYKLENGRIYLKTFEKTSDFLKILLFFGNFSHNFNTFNNSL